MKVLHVLESSIPDTGGYTVRALAIVDRQRRLGLEPVVVTSPFFPGKGAIPRVESIDGVRYHRTNHIPVPGRAPNKLASYAYRLMMMHRYRSAVLEIVRQERPDIIHSHSSYSNPFAALPAARRMGLPLIYEVRTLWGESAVIEDGLREDSWKYRMVWRFELAAMRRADAVIPIAAGIRDELVRRGVEASKMTIIPNGVDSSLFVPRPRDTERVRRYGLEGQFVAGYIGTLRRLEGLATLVEAQAIARAKGANIALVIVGDGPDRPQLQALAARLGSANVVFAGTVPHEDVASWYSVMDALVYPRVRARINERVTPLKPLEAMALGKVCLASDVGGLLELIRDDETGVIFPSGDAGALAGALVRLSGDRALRERLGRSATEYVRRERDWSAIIPHTAELYDRLLRARREGHDASGA